MASGVSTPELRAGVGVIGASSKGAGVVAVGTTADLLADGTGAVLLNKPNFTTTPPTTTVVGTIRVAPTAPCITHRWQGFGSDRPGPAAPATSMSSLRCGSTTPVSAVPTPNGKLSTGQNRVVSIKDARNEVTGVVTTADVESVGAKAIVANLTVTLTEGDLGGFLSVVPGDATTLSGSSINWSGPDENVANGLTVKIAADRTVKVFCGGVPTPRTHFVIDVSGYSIHFVRTGSGG